MVNTTIIQRVLQFMMQVNGTVVITKSSTAKNLAALKEGKKTDASASAYSALQSTDWYVTRKEEISTAIPSKITAYRTAVRLVCNSLKTAIDSASDVDGLHFCTGATQMV